MNIKRTDESNIKLKIPKTAKTAFNDLLDSDEDIREFNIEVFRRKEQNSMDADIESKMYKIVQDDFYNDFDDLNDDDEF